MQEKLQAEAEKALAFWTGVAEKNNWENPPKYVQVWHDEEGNTLDSIYLPDDAGQNYFVLDTGDEEDEDEW